jgi:hypothetical protein
MSAQPKKCEACRFSFMEPDDMNLTCGHKDSGTFGLYVHRAVEQHCGPDLSKFEQHPLRGADGSLGRR